MLVDFMQFNIFYEAFMIMVTNYIYQFFPPIQEKGLPLETTR